MSVLELFASTFTTPNILTEVSNLSGQLYGRHKHNYSDTMAREIVLMEERYLPSGKLAPLPEMKMFGLTDTGLAQLARDGYLVLTDDLRLYNYLTNFSLEVINFNHIREFSRG